MLPFPNLMIPLINLQKFPRLELESLKGADFCSLEICYDSRRFPSATWKLAMLVGEMEAGKGTAMEAFRKEKEK